MLRELVALYGHACELERTEYLIAESRLHVQLRRLDAVIESHEAELVRRDAEAERLAQPTPEEWLAVRFPGEEFLSPVATRTRRQIAHRRQLNEAKAAKDAAQQLVHEAHADRSELQAELQRRAEIARSRVQRHRERTERMAAIYRRTIVKRHPEREELITRWQTDICVVPDEAADMALLPSEASTEMPA
ncbi:hypothetical protein ACI78T_17270 [Blastococcus sp. SYSU D00922]